MNRSRTLSLLLVAFALASGCTEYDDSAIRSELGTLESEINRLTLLCQSLNTDVQTLETLLNSDVKRVLIRSITTEGDACTIVFSDGKTYTFHNGKDGNKGDTGQTPSVPVIGIRQDTDGIWYWTLDGKWLTDQSGKKIRASAADGADAPDGVAPSFKIENDYWYISTDGGKNWTRLGKAKGEDSPASLFKEVRTDNEDYVVFVLADGSELTVSRIHSYGLASVSAIPDCERGIYADYIKSSGESFPSPLKLAFVIEPASCLDQIVSSPDETLELELVYTKTRAAGDRKKLAISKVAKSGTVLVVTAVPEFEPDYYDSREGASVSLTVNLGEDSISSGYIPLVQRFREASPVKSSNCIIAKQNSVISFAAVKGNSNISVGNIADVRVLWETFNNTTTPAEGDVISDAMCRNGHVTIVTGKHYGNALVAARDENGSILWSWHIWIPDGDPVANQQMTKDKSAILLDRNLGAITAKPGDAVAKGLYYQWGRKDPFIDHHSMNSTSSWTSSSETSVEYSISHPDFFLPSLDSKPELWKKEKTIYDPCPDGWRVPENYNWLVTAKLEKSTSGWQINTSLAETSAWYPCTGYLDNSNGVAYSTYAYLWTSNDNEETNRNCYSSITGTSTISSSSFSNSQYATPVRCCKEGYVKPKDVNLSENGTANCYIVNTDGEYRFKAVKGNTNNLVGIVKTVDVLWETANTTTAPAKGSIIYDVSYSDEEIRFTATGEAGNALIAAKNAYGTVLWSWHIWSCPDYDPVLTQETYDDKTGIMMDRNLGALTADCSDPLSFGLLYQWGRKDPFMGNTSATVSSQAKATASFPTTSSNTIEYSVQHPTTFILQGSYNYDWYYNEGSSLSDVTRWQSEKTEYDPCPPGWKVPDMNIWKTTDYPVNNFSNTHYPASGHIIGSNGSISPQGTNQTYYWFWSSSSGGTSGANTRFGNTLGRNTQYKSNALAVRCCREDFETPEYTYLDLGKDETANCYIVANKGRFQFKPVKGNAPQSVEGISSASVLWETVNTGSAPAAKSLISEIEYKNGYVRFTATGTDGNALIAAKDASGNVLWSWHIWICKDFIPEKTQQTYRNNAGILMDRNLGALSTEKGNALTRGLLYQWGRKDPFPGLTSQNTAAQTTPSQWTSVVSSSSNGSINYATQHPTTFITGTTGTAAINDWMSNTDNTLWGHEKTIYDPCPPGWRVPDGGFNGVWDIAELKAYGWSQSGMPFNAPYCTPDAYYPGAGYRVHSSGSYTGGGTAGYYWSGTAPTESNPSYAYGFVINQSGNIITHQHLQRATGASVRCQKK